ncbi:MAG: shikimate kinase [Acidimicrobiia bacterium]|nr:shikimate kinase [Acidimicrobiia bacterium]
MSREAQRHLVLIGLMGAGKSTVGELCAQQLDRPFVDTDRVVEANTGRSVAEIFTSGGEATFRSLEHDAVADACASPQPLVISCGGGAVLDPENRAQMRATGVVVWLRASPSSLAARVQHNLPDRPLLASTGAEQELERLTELRTPAYEGAAHIVVDTDGRTVADTVDAVLAEVERCTV